MPFEFISRSDWGAQPAYYIPRQIPNPITKVQFVYDTESEECHTRAECIEIVQELQKLHRGEDKLDDINFNFLVGGDGNVYEGRGWDNKIQKHPSWDSDVSNCIVVGFIGNFTATGPPRQMLEVADEFIRTFTENGMLSKERVEIKI